jgi:hypothetical protein
MFKIKNEEVLWQSHKSLDDLTSGQLFTFVGRSELYLMTDDNYYVAIPSGFSYFIDSENTDAAVNIVNAEITIL